MSADLPRFSSVDALTGLGLGPVDQISFAIADIDASLPAYQAVFGKFTVRDSVMTADNLTYRGEPTAAEVRLAFCRSGELEIELVQVLSGEWPTTDHLERHGQGLHHVRFIIDDLVETLDRMYDAGFGLVLQGVSPRGSKFAYLESQAILGYTMIELLQQPTS
jgi:methylmalonyl-CoA/ethylmalonyl-CoA epimerase